MARKERRLASGPGAGGKNARKKSSKNAKDECTKDAELANKEIDLKNVRNKIKRAEIANQLKREKKLEKSRRRRENREKELRGEEVVKGVPRTIENTREIDETFVKDPLNDKELHKEMENDEFSDYFSRKRPPKLLITTSNRVSKHMYTFLKEIVAIIPNCDFYKRNGFNIKDIIKEVNEKGTENNYTDILIFTEHPIKKIPWGLYICHLPVGPTSYFRIRSLKLAQDMKGTAFSTTHNPEVILNNFDTRVGYRIGRQLASLFPFNPDFEGRRVIAFHNQRDFIFFRHYRYIFRRKRTSSSTSPEEKQEQAINSAGLQEIGPRFTLKLMWIQEGTFNTKKGVYEYLWRPDLQVNRKVFFL
ncbi:IMP4-like U3 small nucleolar ribonucleoprotein (snoRNP) [Cryptosporidium canis]|uniref:IMP4-like U3 small nucleolar ribonucleoprotein (snoRNP) n=1 Tax=Cryptosporidium canis TaxID=195482 RepID=A0ABQ8P2Y1_9CRYT|nr:IMP4-like U3 small nucleolar ribonucleoprotein (snoRNP) [Cryptosporidium canis]KAJ1605375.1 IMP4-like U3 small nucleolar ribonucleoprotein (snoRNP) [Cryptosporidium canis]